MKYISNVLFAIGLIACFVGICMADANILLAVKIMFGGLLGMFCGWLLGELFGWEVEEDDFKEYLRHLPPEP